MPVSELMAFIFSFLVSAFSTILGFFEKERNWTKIIIWLALACTSLGFGLYYILDKAGKAYDSTNRVISKSDSISIIIQKEVNRAIDSTRTSILDSVKNYSDNITDESKRNKEEIIERMNKDASYPHLNLCATIYRKSNPNIISVVGDSIRYGISLCNDGTDVAVDLIDNLVAIQYLSGKPILTSVSKSIANKSTEIGVNQPGRIFDFFITPAAPSSDTSFIYLRVSYRGEKNSKLSYMKKIFAILPTNKITEVPGDIYSKISKVLIKNKLW